MSRYATYRGRTDWWMQRATAISLLITFLVYLFYFSMSTTITYQSWLSFVFSWPVILLNIVSIIAIAMHSWVGIWTVITDYVSKETLQNFFVACLRIYLATLVIVPLFIVIWMGCSHE